MIINMERVKAGLEPCSMSCFLHLITPKLHPNLESLVFSNRKYYKDVISMQERHGYQNEDYIRADKWRQ